SSRRRHTRFSRDWSSDVCSSDLAAFEHLEWIGVAKPKCFVGRHRIDDLLTQPPVGLPLNETNQLAKTLQPLLLHQLVEPTGNQEIGRASCRERVESSAGEGSR